jgi:hypothetical protein
MQPAEAIRGFLDAFEIPPERIPVTLDVLSREEGAALVTRRLGQELSQPSRTSSLS